MPDKRFIIIMLTAACLLVIPYVAMQFTAEVQWTLGDFAVAGVLLFGTGILMELILRKIKKRMARIIVIAMLLLVFLLIWAELAVGVFGTPFAGS